MKEEKDCEPTLLLLSLSKPYVFPLPLSAGKDPLFSSGVQDVFLSLSCLCHRKACEATLLRYLKVKSMKEAPVKENVREIELFGPKARKRKMKRDDRIEVLAKTMISGLDGKITKAQQVTIF